jgi:hypothetical protein
MRCETGMSLPTLERNFEGKQDGRMFHDPHERTRAFKPNSGCMLNLIKKSFAPLSLKLGPILSTYKSVWIRSKHSRDVLKDILLTRVMPIAVAARSKARTVFARSNTQIMGSNPTRGMGVCVCSVCVYFVSFTVIPASRKRRQKGNSVVSGETVMYGYESSATLTTDRLHYKLQTCPLVREGRILPPQSLRVVRGDRKGTQ